MFGGFTCSKNSLIALNAIYVVVALTLISVAAYAKFASIVSSPPILSGIILCGTLLLIISIVGLFGAVMHHQVMLFFYMVILFIIFIIQFSIACACLAMNDSQQHEIVDQGWTISGESIQKEAQFHFHCCGFKLNNTIAAIDCVGPNNKPVLNMDGKQCCDLVNKDCCTSTNKTISSTCQCHQCNDFLYKTVKNGLSTVGGIGLFFSFTEFIGVWLTVRFRNQRDPRINPSAFL